MKKYVNIILTIFLCLILYGCGESTKVTFNYNCPGVNDYKCSVLENKLNCMFTMPECDGKTFVGWYDAKASGNKVNLDKDFTESTTVYAYWKEDMIEEPAEEPTTPIEEPAEEPVEIIEIKYKLSFNPNGGNGGQSETIEVKYKESLPQINDIIPTRDGYTFMGWYDNSDYTNGIEYYDSKCNSLRTYDKASDMTLYAGWKEIEVKPVTPTPVEETKYTVSFNTNGGSGGQSSSVQITYGSDMPSINKTIPKKTGYEFMGWYDNSDYTKGNMYYNDKCEAVRNFNRKNDMTLYAGWKIKTYLINFNSNSGSGGQTGSLSVTYNSQLPTINKSKPTRSGYTFTGWYDNSDYTKGTKYYNENCEAVKSYDKTTNLTLYAGWSKVVIVYKYKVTFDINGGNGTPPTTVEATLGSAMPSITTSVPSKSGYTFMGWYDNANYLNGTQYYTNQNKSARSYDRMSDVKLYAGWKDDTIKCTITYNANGGTGAPGIQTYNYATSGTINLSTTKPTRAGYSFLGWATSSTAKAAAYSAGQTWNKSNKGNYTLYAVWGSTLKIYYLSLGRYDGFLIIGNGTTIFIDGGYVSQGKKCVDFLKEMGITKIDALIGSHLHNNHIDAHKVIIDNFEIGHAYYGDDPRTCKKRRTCSEDAATPAALNKKLENIPVTILTPGFDVKIGNLTFDILAPMTLHDSPNGNSLHMILKYGDQKFYFTGDACSRVPGEIYNTYDHSVFANVTVYKHPHHGECELPQEYINVISPKYVIVPSTKKAKAEHAYDKVGSTVYELGGKLVENKIIIGAGDSLKGYLLIEADGQTVQITDKRY